VSNWDVQRVAEGEILDLVEGLAPLWSDKSRTGHCGGVGPSETAEEPTRMFSKRRTRRPLRIVLPHFWKKKKLWMIVTYLDLLAPYQEATRNERT
jgi:hypothetical protein